MRFTSNGGSSRSVVKHETVDAEQAVVKQPFGQKTALPRYKGANGKVMRCRCTEVNSFSRWWVCLERLLVVVSGFAIPTEVESGVAGDERVAQLRCYGFGRS